jgi:hypothetical protein
MTSAANIFELDPRHYQTHSLHGHEREFRETNCYVDVWIEILHALGLEPTACLAFTLASDFEGDQWTFFKPPHGDLQSLYGVQVEELTLWRPLLEHVQTQVARRRLPLVEVDSYFLPDTVASDYHRQHVKTTIGITHVDSDARRLRYFHNAGFYELADDDFDGLLRVGLAPGGELLPPYCEIVKPERSLAHAPPDLRRASEELARRYFALRPARNPVSVHREQLEADVAMIASGGLPTYHGYCFAVLRQLGANFELAATYLRWLSEDPPMREAAESFLRIANVSKMLILRLARVANAGRGGDLSGRFDEMAESWDVGMARLAVGLTSPP